MSGKWAREADIARERMLGRTDLAAAASYIALAFTALAEFRPLNLRRASAIIRRERKALGATAPRLPDWSTEWTDEALTWTALRMIAEVGSVRLTKNQQAYRLRQAEACLRTLHKRHRPARGGAA